VSELTKKVKNSGQSVNIEQAAGFPMRVSDSSMGGEADQFHTTCGTVKTLIRRLRKQYLAVVREEVSRTVSAAPGGFAK
jgi:hypothetical protein